MISLLNKQISSHLKLLISWNVPKNFTGILETPNRDKHWFLNGKYHRANGPAIIELDGTKEWHVNGKLHRTDGPAIEWFDGEKRWYLNNKRYSEEEWQKKRND